MNGPDGPKVRGPAIGRPGGKALIEALRLLRFGIVGFSALGVYWLVTNGLASTGLPLLPASVVGYVASGFVSYFGHSYFSFRVSADHRAYGFKFLIVALLGLIIDIVLVQVCSAARIPAALTTALIGITIPVFNYVFNRLWVFSSGLDGGGS